MVDNPRLNGKEIAAAYMAGNRGRSVVLQPAVGFVRLGGEGSKDPRTFSLLGSQGLSAPLPGSSRTKEGQALPPHASSPDPSAHSAKRDSSGFGSGGSSEAVLSSAPDQAANVLFTRAHHPDSSETGAGGQTHHDVGAAGSEQPFIRGEKFLAESASGASHHDTPRSNGAGIAPAQLASSRLDGETGEKTVATDRDTAASAAVVPARYASRPDAQTVWASAGGNEPKSGDGSGKRTRVRQRGGPPRPDAGSGAVPPGEGPPAARGSEDPDGGEFLVPQGPVVFLDQAQIAAGNVRTPAATELLEYGYQTDFSEGVVDRGELQRLVNLRLVRARKHPTEELWVLNYSERNQERLGITESVPLAELSRGLIIDREGRIRARPFGQIQDIEAAGELPPGGFTATDKVDGSLGITYWRGDTPYVATRGTFADRRGTIGYATQTVQEYAETLHADPAGFQFDPRNTYLWEIIEPDKPHVVDYPEKQVVLLAIRDTRTGRDLPLPQQSEVPFPVVTQYPELQRREQIDEHLQSHPDSEGVVILMDDGKRYRIKTDEWIKRDRMQRDIDIGVWQTTVWKDFFEGSSIEDILYRTPARAREQVREYTEEMLRRFDRLGTEEFRWDRVHPTNETDSILTLSENPWMMTIYENLRAGTPLPEILNSFPPPLFLQATEYGERLMRRFNFLGSETTRMEWLVPLKETRESLEEASSTVLQKIIWKELYIGIPLEEVVGNIPEARREEARGYGEALAARQRSMKGSQESRWQWLRPERVAERAALEEGTEYSVQLTVWSGLRSGLRLGEIIGDFPESRRELVQAYGEELLRQYQEIIEKDFVAQYPYNQLRPKQ